MNILLTNDDGYKAEGFYELKHALEREGHFVIACSTVETLAGVGRAETYLCIGKWKCTRIPKHQFLL